MDGCQAVLDENEEDGTCEHAHIPELTQQKEAPEEALFDGELTKQMNMDARYPTHDCLRCYPKGHSNVLYPEAS